MRKFSKLKTAIFDAELTQEYLAKQLGRGQTYLSRRMNGKEPFNTLDIQAISKELHISPEQWHEYFWEQDT